MRDRDFMRAFLLKIANSEDNRVFLGRALSPDPETKMYLKHAELLCDEGLMSEIKDGVFRLTSAGYDAAEAIADDKLWKKLIEASPKEAYEIIKNVGSSVAVTALSKLMGWG